MKRLYDAKHAVKAHDDQKSNGLGRALYDLAYNQDRDDILRANMKRKRAVKAESLPLFKDEQPEG